MNSLVFSDEQRAMATDPVVRRLLELIPRANLVDASGASRFVGSAAAVADHDRWTVDVRHAFTASARLHGFHGGQYARLVEPGIQGTTIPGFGSRSRPLRSLVTVDETQTFGSALVNEARFGRSALRGGSFVRAELNPADFGIQNGVIRGIGLPMINVAGGLIFGGPANYPSGRYDASYVLNDTASYTRGRHMVRFGGEYRRFLNENFAEGTGSYNFPSISAFLSGTANAFGITLGNRVNHIDQRALALFFQDRIAAGSSVTVDLGLRYEWHVTPTEHDDQFVVFDAESISLRRVGVDLDEIYRQNNRNLEPRLGVAWDAWRDGRTIVRAAYGRSVDEPGTTVVRDTAGNPPFATPLAATGAIPLATSLSVTRSEGLAPATVDPRFRNASLQSWNVNVQHQLAWDLAAMAGYFGSRGKDLRITRNINQPVNGVRPFGSLSSTSPILPNSPLGNIMQVESSGFSRYNALWLSLTKRQSRGVQFDASYTWSKSLDTNSLNSSGFAVQDSYDIARQYGLSDFDARHRFIVSVTYSLPFTGHVLTRGWQLAAIVQSQSGNPVNIVTSNSLLNGMPNSVRPDRHWPHPHHRFGRPVVRHIGVRGRRSLRQSGSERGDRPGLPQHGPVAQQEPDDGSGHQRAIARGCVRSVQPPQLRSAGKHRRKPDLRQDYEDALLHRRRWIFEADAAGAESVVLNGQALLCASVVCTGACTGDAVALPGGFGSVAAAADRAGGLLELRGLPDHTDSGRRDS